MGLHHSRRPAGFTLVELLIAVALLLLMSVLLFSLTEQTSSLWRYTQSRSEQFQAARVAYETLTRNLGQATLNTYWDYDNLTKPTKYQRKSELRFVVDKAAALLGSDLRRPGHAVFFQVPRGFTDDAENFGSLPNLLNTWGYFLEFSGEERPAPIENLGAHAPPQRHRYRLMELMEPTSEMSVYNNTAASARDWFLGPIMRKPRPVHVLAENIIQLVIQPRLSRAEELKKAANPTLAPNYRYSSYESSADARWLNQLPPVVDVTMVALDEVSASRVANGDQLPEFDRLLETFTRTANYDTDLAALQAALVDRHSVGIALNYRVFTSSVSLRGARWSAK